MVDWQRLSAADTVESGEVAWLDMMYSRIRLAVLPWLFDLTFRYIVFVVEWCFSQSAYDLVMKEIVEETVLDMYQQTVLFLIEAHRWWWPHICLPESQKNRGKQLATRWHFDSEHDLFTSISYSFRIVPTDKLNMLCAHQSSFENFVSIQNKLISIMPISVHVCLFYPINQNVSRIMTILKIHDARKRLHILKKIRVSSQEFHNSTIRSWDIRGSSPYCNRQRIRRHQWTIA